MITELPLNKLKQFYKENVVRDFPKNERRPYRTIKKLYKKGWYRLLCMYDGNSILQGYAFLFYSADKKTVLLDYFAVMPNMRGSGIGSSFLCQMVHILDVDGIIIESEFPESAPNDHEKTIRNKRIAFYTRNKAQLSDYLWTAFNVDYNLLWIPVKCKYDGRNIAQQVNKLYKECLPIFVGKRFLSYKKTKNNTQQHYK